MGNKEDKICLEVMSSMRAGSCHTFYCYSVADFQSALRLAYWVRKHHPRKDGYTYQISNNAARAAVTIRVVKP